MARMPGAIWKPLANNWASQPAMANPDIVVIHTMVGSLAGTDSYFRDGNGSGFSGTESHFGTGHDGEIRQWQDTAYQADANLNGNHRIISIENADYGVGFGTWNTNDGGAVPAFTAAQIEAIAKIVAWACKTHDIPCVLIPDSKPGRRGVGYHRQGVDPYRVSGGEQWSTAYGKVCPGAKRVAQIPQIITRARQIASGDTAPRPEEFLMALSDSEQEDLYRRVKQLTEPNVNGKTLPTAVRDLHQTYYVTEHDRAGVPADAEYAKGRAIHLLRWADGNAQVLRAEIAALRALAAAQQGIDPDELERIIRDAIAASVVQVDVNVQGGDDHTPKPPA